MSGAAPLIERIGALIHQAIRDDAARHGLLPVQLMTLEYLSCANDYSNIPIAIAEYFGMTRGTVSQTVGVLVKKGLVERQPCGDNRKLTHLALTAAGRDVLNGSWAFRLERAMLAAPETAGMTEERLALQLRALLTGLQRLNGNHAFGVCKRCAYFEPGEAGAGHCGLTHEPLASSKTSLICREWQLVMPPARKEKRSRAEPAPSRSSSGA